MQDRRVLVGRLACGRDAGSATELDAASTCLGPGATAAIPSDPLATLLRMGGLSDHGQESDYEAFVGRWLASLVAVFLRAVRDPALAYDLATETLAAARLQWEFAPSGDAGVEWVLHLGANVLDAAVERGRVPATERRRGQQPAPRRLTVAEQREIMALAEQHVELPAAARHAADALARMAPPPHVLAGLRSSDLVQAELLPDPGARADHTAEHHRDWHGA
jgi:hypothetical protein